MDARAKLIMSGGLFATLTMVYVITSAQTNRMSGVRWNIKVNETKGPVRAADISTRLGSDVVSEILAGPPNGADDAYMIFTRMPPGARGPALFTLPDAHHYMVLEGKMTITIGTDKFVVEPYQGVSVPPGVPHEAANADTGETRVFEAIAPGSSRDLLSMLKPAQPRKVENAGQFIRALRVPAENELKQGLNGIRFAERQKGNNEQIRIDSTLPGSGGPKPHVHKFTQAYFSIQGETTLMHGLMTYPLPKYSLGVIEPGTVHTNNNKSATPERHLTLLFPEPLKPSSEEPWDIEVEFVGAVQSTQRQ
jgi:quercetin dioxygenase-like cupin family protein